MCNGCGNEQVSPAYLSSMFSLNTSLESETPVRSLKRERCAVRGTRCACTSSSRLTKGMCAMTPLLHLHIKSCFDPKGHTISYSCEVRQDPVTESDHPLPSPHPPSLHGGPSGQGVFHILLVAGT